MSRNLLQERWQQLPESVVRRLQAEQLRRYLRTVVLPFSAHYRELFREHRLDADSIRTLDDLQRLPFTTKSDLLNTPERPQRPKDFIIVPDEKSLVRRPATILRALFRGREGVRKELEAELMKIKDDDVKYLTGNKTTLQLIFFDGEEAFVRWTATDSLYGSRYILVILIMIIVIIININIFNDDFIYT